MPDEGLKSRNVKNGDTIEMVKPSPHGGTHKKLICFVCKEDLTEQMSLDSEAHLDFDYDIDKWVVFCTTPCRDNRELYSQRIDRLVELKELRDSKRLSRGVIIDG